MYRFPISPISRWDELLPSNGVGQPLCRSQCECCSSQGVCCSSPGDLSARLGGLGQPAGAMVFGAAQRCEDTTEPSQQPAVIDGATCLMYSGDSEKNTMTWPRVVPAAMRCCQYCRPPASGERSSTFR